MYSSFIRATLLLSHSPSQTFNQQRLESYLASYGQPDLDVTSHLQNSPTGKKKQRLRDINGADTPKDLSARVKILELFTLHVLPRNDEWDYAKEFINLSEVLDDERKDVFLQTLENLQEEKERGSQRAAQIQQEKEEELERQRQEEEQERIRTDQKSLADKKASSQGSIPNGHNRMGSEVDYGIENANPAGASPNSKQPRNGNAAASKSSIKPHRNNVSSQPLTGRTTFSPPPAPPESSSSKGVKRPDRPSQPALLRQLRVFTNLIIMLAKNTAHSVSANPMAFLRTLLFLMGVILALGRPDVRDRVRRVLGAGWQKVRGTIGMGVKVSYI